MRKRRADEKFVFDWWKYGRREDDGMPDYEKTDGTLCIPGWRLVLGYASIYGDAGDESHGDGKYMLSSEPVYPLFCLRDDSLLLGNA